MAHADRSEVRTLPVACLPRADPVQFQWQRHVLRGGQAREQSVRCLRGEQDLRRAGNGPHQEARDERAGYVVDDRSDEREAGEVCDLDGDRGTVAGADL